LRVYSLATASLVLDVPDTEVSLVQPTEVNGPEVDGPEASPDLLEPDELALEEVRDEDFAVLPANGGVLGDFANLEMKGVGNLFGSDGVMNTSKRYSPEVRKRAVRMVLEHEAEYSSQWAAIESISEKFGYGYADDPAEGEDRRIVDESALEIR